MYSMVLMAALTTATDMPDWGRRGGCCGCHGGGWGWGGCYGGYGGWGGGGYGWGGWGGGYGGWGGGYGGGWGGMGGWGGWGGYVYAPVAATYAAPTAIAYNPIPTAAPLARSMYYSPNPADNNRATITVHVPQSASLMVDGKPTTSITATRRFHSPPLQPGKTYHYTFEARMERDGKMVKANRSVDVTAGSQRDITIALPDLNPPPERQQTAKPAEKKGSRDRRAGG